MWAVFITATNRSIAVETGFPNQRFPEIVLTLRKEPGNHLINIDRFSNYTRLIRTTARILCLKLPQLKYSLKTLVPN